MLIKIFVLRWHTIEKSIYQIYGSVRWWSKQLPIVLSQARVDLFFLKTNRKEIYETFRLQTANQLPKLNFLELV